MAKAEKLEYTSKNFFNRVLRKYFRRTNINFKPALTDPHKCARLNFVREISGLLIPQREELMYYNDPRTMLIHCDEKWFYALSHSMKVYVPKGQQSPRFNVPSKSFIPKVMFFAAIGRPIFNQQNEVVFDGKVYFHCVKEKTPYVRVPHSATSKMKTEYCSVTKERFISFMKTTVSKAVSKYNPLYMDRIVIQVDNAGGHGGGRGNMAKTAFAELKEWVEKQRAKKGTKYTMPILFLAQPGRSPDLNVLDLGAWHSLQYAVGAVLYRHSTDQETKTWESQVEKKCIKTWNKWNTVDTLSKLFRTLQNVHICIISTSGENYFNVPHEKKTKKMVKYSTIYSAIHILTRPM